MPKLVYMEETTQNLNPANENNPSAMNEVVREQLTMFLKQVTREQLRMRVEYQKKYGRGQKQTPEATKQGERVVNKRA